MIGWMGSEISTFLSFFSRRKRAFFFFQAEDGIRDIGVTGVQTCALPISSAAMVQAYPVVSKAVIVRTPLLPASRPAQVSSVVAPRAEMRPMRVTTTRRGVELYTFLVLAFRALLEILDRFFHGARFFSVVFGDVDLERLFEAHDEFYGVERIGAEVFGERCVRSDFGFVDAKLLDDDLLDFFCDCRPWQKNRMPFTRRVSLKGRGCIGGRGFLLVAI